VSVSVSDSGSDSDACAPREVGPFDTAFAEGSKRNVYFVAPHESTCETKPHRLIANLHGLCNPPGYACGYWTGAASDRGFLVCPEGNATCGAGGPPSWDESFDAMDRDLERSIADVSALYPNEVDRRGAVLTGFSRGAYAAPFLALAHPNRWSYLVLVEADVSLDAWSLRRAGVKAVALLAGEYGSQITGERATVEKLQKQGFPARFWTMSKAGHYYSADIDALMGEAIDWVVRQGEVAPD
jgi:predicted esterase